MEGPPELKRQFSALETRLAESGAVPGTTLVERERIATAVLGYGVVLLIGVDQLLRL